MTMDAKRWLYFVVGYALALMPILLLRDLTPENEMRYLSIVDDALLNHTFFTFHLDGEIYADKPPLYFWLMMLSKLACGGYCPWLMILLFSAVPGVAIVRIMDKWLAEEVDGRWRIPATAMVMTSAFFFASAIVLRMDMLMTLFIVLSLRSFWRIRQGEGDARRERWLFPVYLFLALFTKGPIGVLMPLCGTLAFLIVNKEIRQIGRYWGWRTWGVLLGCCAVWFGLVYAEGGWAYLDNMLFHQTVGRAVNSFRHPHSAFYYCTAIWYIIAPWSLIVIGSVAASLRTKEHRSDLQRFMLSVSVATFVMLSCISSKLQVYMLPAIPFFVYSAAIALPKYDGSAWLRAGIAIPAAAFALALPGIIIMARIDGFTYLASPFFYVAAGLLSASGVCAIRHLWIARADSGKAINIMATGFVCAIFIGSFGISNLTF